MKDLEFNSNIYKVNKIKKLLFQEMELNGINWNSYDWLLDDDVFDEIAHLVIAEAHEGIISTSGKFFINSLEELKCEEILFIEIENLKTARLLANGQDCFLLYEKNVFKGLAYFKYPLLNELALVRVFPPSGGLFIQRSDKGVVKFFQGNNIIYLENRVWRSMPLIKEAAWKVSRCLPEVDHIVLKNILEFVYHLLSPMPRVGTTIVWWLQEIPENGSEYDESGQNIKKLNISILDEKKNASLCNYLSLADGAIFLDLHGVILRVGVHLKNSKKSIETISEFKGTRHTSAKRFSFDKNEALVFTVSSDGLVSIFADGVNLNELIISPATKISFYLKAKYQERTQDITHLSYERICKSCHKLILIEQVNVAWMNEPKRINCPVCKKSIDEVDCYSIESRPIKWLDHKDFGEILPKLNHEYSAFLS